MRTKWCCAQLKGSSECAGTRGLAVFVESRHGREPFFVVQCRSVDMEDQAQLNTPFPVSITTETGISYCPWCGKNLRKWYKDRMDELTRNDLVVELPSEPAARS